MAKLEDLTPGTVFKAEGSTWRVDTNDGFIFDADNLDKKSPTVNLMWIGVKQEFVDEYEIIQEDDYDM